MGIYGAVFRVVRFGVFVDTYLAILPELMRRHHTNETSCWVERILLCVANWMVLRKTEICCSRFAFCSTRKKSRN